MAQGVPGRLRPQIILTFRHYKGGRSSAKHTGRFYPRRNPWYSLSEAESTSGHMVLSGVPRKKFPVTPTGIDPGTVRLVTQRLNHYSTPDPSSSSCSISSSKAVPLQACSGPEGSRKLRFPDFMTAAQDGGKVVSITHRPPLPPRNTPGTHFC